MRKLSLDTRLRSVGELVRKEREEERCLAWLAAPLYYPDYARKVKNCQFLQSTGMLKGEDQKSW